MKKKEEEMKRAVWGVAFLAIVSLIILACEQTTPTPEVHIVKVDPPQVYVAQGDSTPPDVTISLKCTNSVDAVLEVIEYTYRDEKGNPMTGVDQVTVSVVIYIPGLPEEDEPTDVKLAIPLVKVIEYMYDNDEMAATVDILFRGVDNYGYGKPFDVDCDMGVVRRY